MTEEKRIKYSGKDTVFRDMFSNPKYLLQLYRVLHSEDESITEADLEIVTLQSILLNGIYNDLGFLVRSILPNKEFSSMAVVRRKCQSLNFMLYIQAKKGIIQMCYR